MTTRMDGTDGKEHLASKILQREKPIINYYAISNYSEHVLRHFQVHLEKLEFEKALNSILQTLKISPDCPLTCKQAGQVHEALENYEEANRLYERAKESLTIHRNGECCTVEEDVNLPYFQRRIMAVKLKKVLKHLTQNLTSVAKKPKSKSTIENMEKSQLNPVSIGNFYRDQMNYLEAVKYYNKVDDDAEVELNLGIFKLMGRGCDENIPEAVKRISNAAQKNLYDANKEVINRIVYDARCIMDILAKEGLSEDSCFEDIKRWIERRRHHISRRETDKLFSDPRSDNIKPSRTQLPLETVKPIFDNAMELQKNEDFEKALVLLQTASELGYYKKNRIKIVKSKLAIIKFTKWLPIVGDCNNFFKNNTTDREFFLCFLSTNHNENGEHQKALEEYKKVHKKSMVIAVAEFLFGIESVIDDFENSIIDILQTSSEKWRSNAGEDVDTFMEIDLRRILEIIELINCGD